METAFEQGADLESKRDSGKTPLMVAITWSRPRSVEVLLTHKPGPDLHASSLGDSPLTLAVRYGGSQLLHMLLDAGITPRHRDAIEANKLILHEIVRLNHVDILRRLLLYNLPINAKDAAGNTPLNCITTSTNPEIIRLLIQRGAYIDYKDNVGLTPLAWRVTLDDWEKAKLFLQLGACPDAQLSYMSGTPLHLACNIGSLEMIEALFLEDFRMSGDAGIMGTIFQAACQRVDESRGSAHVVLEYLLEGPKFDPTMSSRHRGSNLSTACFFTDLQIVKRLVELKVSINKEDILGRRPVHFVLYKGLELVEYLSTKGADFSATDLMKRNVLHFGVASGRLELVTYILDRNPDFVHREDCDGWTPFFWAVRECLLWGTESNQRGAITEALIVRGASIPTQAQGIDRQWTPYELARYYTLSGDIIKALAPTREAAQKSDYAAA
ncbi:ankyrin repeat-containing domain protein [Aspergillus pseudoustus]|uniref:Ankyrin repeat-containing domain protein n=1 Tax=Aspergillus pseudoustus TaxID=1810923 RepID=A0ABR4J2J6_9EURO